MHPSDEAIRHTGIGGSEIALVAGLFDFDVRGKRQTSIDVWRRKVGLAGDEPALDNDAIEMGHFLEPMIIRKWTERRCPPGAGVVSDWRTLQSVEFPWWTVTLDAGGYLPERMGALVGDPGEEWTRDIVGAKRLKEIGVELAAAPGTDGGYYAPDWVVEAKSHTSRAARAYGEEDTDDVPRDKVAQGQWQMGLTRASHCDLPVLSDTSRFRFYRVYRDDVLIDVMKDAAEHFWMKHVIPRIPPPPDGSRSRDEWIRSRIGLATDRIAVATPEIEKEVQRLAGIKATLKRLRVEEARIGQVIKEFMGPAGFLRGPDGPDGEDGAPLASLNSNKAAAPVYKDVVDKLIERFGMTDEEAEIVIDASRDAVAPRPLLIKVKA